MSSYTNSRNCVGRLVLVTAPTVEPLSLEEAKHHLNVTHAEDDTLIESLITTARKRVEHETQSALVTQTWDCYLDRFPEWTIPLRRPPVASVSSVTYIASDGSTTTASSSTYRLDTASKPARLTPAWSETWPATRDVTNAVAIRFVAGQGSSAVPDEALHAMRLLIGHWYRNREEVITGTITAKLPVAADALLDSLRWGDYS